MVKIKRLHKIIFFSLMLNLTVIPLWADDFQGGADAYLKKDYEKAHKLIFPLAKKGHAIAQFFFSNHV